MLDGLDDAPWETLTHAYGPAADVPGMLRAVAAGEQDALDGLFGNIWHQGTVYEATAHTVPFLIELLSLEGADRASLLSLLQLVATGASYLQVHLRFEPRSRQASQENANTLLREQGWVLAAHDAVVKGVPTYLRLLEDAQEGTAVAAARVLGSCAEAAPAIRQSLVRLIPLEGRARVRAALILTAGQLGGSDAHVSAWLNDSDPAVCVAAAAVAAGLTDSISPTLLAIMEQSAPAALMVMDATNHEEDPCALVLGALADHWELQVRLLVTWMKHDNAVVRENAVIASEGILNHWRPAAPLLVPSLASCLSDPAPGVRQWAAAHLAACGKLATAHADALWTAARDQAPVHSQASAASLVALCKLHDPRAGQHVRAILERLAPPEKTWRQAVSLFSPTPVDLPTGFVTVINHLGPWAGGCLAPLVRLIPVVPAGNGRIAVMDAVGRHGDAARVAIPLLRAEVQRHPHITARVLGALGPLARDALVDLERLLRHPDDQVRVLAASATWRISGKAGAALALVKELLGRAAPHHVRSAAVELLGELGKAGDPLAPLLPPLFTSDDDWESARAAVAYWRITQDAARVLPVLLERHVVCLPRGMEAVRCLGEMGPAARDAVTRLEEAVHSPVRQVELAASATWIEVDEAWMQECQAALAHITGAAST